MSATATNPLVEPTNFLQAEADTPLRRLFVKNCLSYSARHFWNLQVRGVGTDLVSQSGECVKFLPSVQSSTKNLSTTLSENTHEQVEANPTQHTIEQA